MPKVEKIPPKLKPYRFHGMILDVGDKNTTTECLWCGTSDKIVILNDTGQWNCLVCGEKGNVYTILRRILARSIDATDNYEELASNRGLLFPESLAHWEVCKSVINQNWLVPGYNSEGRLSQLYCYRNLGGQMKLLATPELPHQMFGVPLYDQKKPQTYLCEGPWDAIALWEIVGKEANVIAVPGANVFKEDWAKLFEGSDVAIMFDNDHPKNGQAGAGIAGVKKTSGLLNGVGSASYLKWGEDGYDPEIPNGFDIRDILKGTDLGSRRESLGKILQRIEDVPEKWIGVSQNKGKADKPKLACVECTEYRKMIQAWRKAMKWTPGLDHALTAMLASIASTQAIGDQLWLKIIGPASCGKSTLCEAVSVNHKYVLAKSTIRGFHSGFTTDSDKTDHSLIAKLGGKTLVTKDGDTLLQSPNLGQILSEARDIYDCVSRTHYRNAMAKDYEGIRMTWLLCGTSSLRSIDSSELGERFLDVVIMEGIDDDLEDEILWRVANRVDRAMGQEANGKPESNHEPEMALAMSLTGGYITWLRENAIDLLASTRTPDWVLRKITRYGKFVAFMRARPSDRQEENAEREFAARLVSQLLRLAKCLAVVLNKTTIDEEVLRRTRQVALDTARGQTLEIINYLSPIGVEGSEIRSIAIAIHRSGEKTTKLLQFLGKIGVLESFRTTRKGVQSKLRWRLTERMSRLVEEVLD